MRTVTALIVLALTLMLLTSPVLAQAESEITVSAATVMESETATVEVRLSDAPAGLSGFIISATSTLPVLDITVNPAFGLSNESPASISGVDTGRVFNAGDTDILLATLTFDAATEGVYQVDVQAIKIDDDLGLPIAVSVFPGEITVTPFMPVVGEHRVADLDGDGIAEDFNGNARFDFDDIVRFFIHLNSPEVQEATVFDWDESGGPASFNDLVLAFHALVGNL